MQILNNWSTLALTALRGYETAGTAQDNVVMLEAHRIDRSHSLDLTRLRREELLSFLHS